MSLWASARLSYGPCARAGVYAPMASVRRVASASLFIRASMVRQGYGKSTLRARFKGFRYTRGFECSFREREGHRVPGLEDRHELGRHAPGYFPKKSRINPTVSIVPWAMTDTQRLRPVTRYKSPNVKPPNPAVIMPDSPYIGDPPRRECL